MAGYGAIVIRGKARMPVYLSIHEGGVRLRGRHCAVGDAQQLHRWLGAALARESGSGLRSIMRIGRAGEKQVSYACVTTETYRHFGRLGLGAVFGSKKLKALVVGGQARPAGGGPAGLPQDLR